MVTGASGYIGGRLVPELLAAGYRVRCLARTPDKLRDFPWAEQAEVVRGDVLDGEAVRHAMGGVNVAYYLVHALGSGDDFEETDRRAARNFADAAGEARLDRLIYLGGLTSRDVPESSLSPHLRSRAEVGRILLDSGVPTTVLRAAAVIGSGSASFEMLRHLTERLPVMVTRRWVRTRIQPIAVADVLRYLVGSAKLPASVSRAFDVGGQEVMDYREMMQRYARVAELPRRLIVSVPMLTPGLSSHWIGLITPVPHGIARPLAESLRHEVVCAEHDIARYLPDTATSPLSFDEALRLALHQVKEAQMATRWSSPSGGRTTRPARSNRSGGGHGPRPGRQRRHRPPADQRQTDPGDFRAPGRGLLRDVSPAPSGLPYRGSGDVPCSRSSPVSASGEGCPREVPVITLGYYAHFIPEAAGEKRIVIGPRCRPRRSTRGPS
nr:NAD(P)H-binding protein [Streptomyces sp. MBT54]